MPECPYCGAELVYEDSWGSLTELNQGRPKGHIYRCPNHQGFSSMEEALLYMTEIGEEVEEGSDPSTICCDSCVHHVSGSFYTTSSGELVNGYPC